MKKLISLFIVLTLAFTLTACWGDVPSADPSEPSTPVDEPSGPADEPSGPSEEPTEPVDPAIEIRTAEELVDAFTSGGKYKLMNDLDIGETYICTAENTSIDLNLNDHTLTLGGFPVYVDYESTANLSNGTIKQTGYSCDAVTCRGELTLSNCTLIGNSYYALYIVDGSVTAENSTLTGGVALGLAYEESASLTATNNVSVSIYEDSYLGINVEKGCVATFGFNPVSMLDSYNVGSVIDNGDGTWTLQYVEVDPL
jgi:hypothetical protein